MDMVHGVQHQARFQDQVFELRALHRWDAVNHAREDAVFKMQTIPSCLALHRTGGSGETDWGELFGARAALLFA